MTTIQVKFFYIILGIAFSMGIGGIFNFSLFSPLQNVYELKIAAESIQNKDTEELSFNKSDNSVSLKYKATYTGDTNNDFCQPYDDPGLICNQDWKEIFLRWQVSTLSF